MPPLDAPAGSMLREWRVRRRRSQLDLALGADVSPRHISFVETGRAQPSRDMIDRLCDELDVPLRSRNDVYLAAGYAPRHRETPLSTATLAAARRAVDLVLAGHEPFPAMAVDGRWTLLAANAAAGAFLDGVPDQLRAPPVNVLRLTLHPDGLAARIANLAEWGAHVRRRVRRQLDRTGDPALVDLLAEVESYLPHPEPRRDDRSPASDAVVPLRLATPQGELAFLYTMTVFGSPRDVTLDEVAIESFFPADDATAAVLGVTRQTAPAGP